MESGAFPWNGTSQSLKRRLERVSVIYFAYFIIFTFQMTKILTYPHEKNEPFINKYLYKKIGY